MCELTKGRRPAKLAPSRKKQMARALNNMVIRLHQWADDLGTDTYEGDALKDAALFLDDRRNCFIEDLE